VAYVILSFHRARGLAQCLRGTDSPEDVVRWEVRHATNEEVRALREGEKAQGAAHRATKE
jgi:hypothetical protein